MAEISGTFHISGGQQNFGGANPSFTQINYYQPGHAAEFREIISLLRRRVADFADPESAQERIAAIERGLAHGEMPDKPAVRDALEGLAGLVTTGTTLADAIDKAIGLLAEHWPF